jgi:ABC-2 type transport system ATP-binding protein
MIRDLGQRRTVLLSTHILSEVEMICPRVIIISDGRIVAEDRTEDLTRRLGVPSLEDVFAKLTKTADVVGHREPATEGRP